VFGNKGLRWKLAAAVVAIALLGVMAQRRGELLNPSLWRCLAQPERWKDRQIWIPGARILSTGPSEHEIQVADARIWVRGPAPADPGARVSYIAVFRSDGPHLEPLKSRKLPDNDHYRWLMEGVSILIALGVFANFARHFLFRPKFLQVEGEAP
jgi:hypothetical protein